jgi:hypothetical protein
MFLNCVKIPTEQLSTLLTFKANTFKTYLYGKAQPIYNYFMNRFLITILTTFCSAITLSQTVTFDSAVRRLYFGVNFIKASGALVDSFKVIHGFRYNGIVSKQSNLNVTIEMNSADAWSSRHLFSFTESPIAGLKIKSGQIEVSIGEAPRVKKLLGVEWTIDFDNEKDATVFFERLTTIFEPLSTKKKTTGDKDVGLMNQYSTRKPGATGIRDIAIILGKSFQTKNYQISLSLKNEFMGD